MGSCCTKPPEPPPDANRQVVVENAAFDDVRAAGGSGSDVAPPPLGRPRAATATQIPAPRKLQVVRGKAVAVRGGKQFESAQRPRRITLSARGPARQQHPAGQRQGQQAARTHETKKKANIANSHLSSATAVGGARHPQPVKIQRFKLSAAELALKCAGLGFGASYADSGAAKVKKAIVKLREGKTVTAAALAAFKKTYQVPHTLLKLAEGEVLRAIGVTRLGVLNAEAQWKEQGRRGPDECEAVVEDRQILLDALQIQIGFASKLGIAALVEKDAELNAAVDAAASVSAAGSFATAVEIATDTGLDMRLIAGVLALREVTSEVAKNAVYFDAGEFIECDDFDDEGDDFADFQKNLKRLHATTTSPQDKAAVEATNALFRIFPGFSAAKLDAVAKLVPSILKDVAIYTEIFNTVINATPQATFDELKRLAATPSQLSDWESRIKGHPGDPVSDSLEYLMVVRHRAADDSITLYNSVHTILATKLPAGCKAASMPGLVKAAQRIIFKTALSYSGKGCFSRCNDIVRLTIRVETMQELLIVLKSLLGSEDILVLRQKHRLDPDKDMSMIGGYRDYQLLVAFKRDIASAAKDGGPEYAVGEIQINLANFIDIKEGVAAGGGGGHGPYKLARSFNGYSPETVVYAGAPSMALAQKIAHGMLLSVTIASGSQSGVDNLEEVAAAMGKALASKNCRVHTFALGANDVLAENMLTNVTEPAPSVASLDLSGDYEIYPGSLAVLPEGVRKLANLQSLNLSSCTKLTTLPEGLSKLVNLQSLDLSGSPFYPMKLTMLPEGLSKLVNLQSLDLESCTKLTTLPEGLGELVHLQSLNLSSCTKLTTLPEGMSKLVRLQSLDLMDCRGLAEPLPDLSHLLPALEIRTWVVSDAAQAWEERGFTSISQ